MSAFITVVFAILSVGGMVYAGHYFQLAHNHLVAFLPVGAMILGSGAALGIALAVRLTRSYDTPGLRRLAEFLGFVSYVVVVLFDYQGATVRVGAKLFPVAQAWGPIGYLQHLVDQGALTAVKQLPSFIVIPPQAMLWVGIGQLILEILGAVIVTGWVISLVADVPFCWRNRRFYSLRYVVETTNAVAVQQWEKAMHERRPIESRAIFARVRTDRAGPTDTDWTRVAVHQCDVCHASRVRIERRHRTLGRIQTDPPEELIFDEARGSALLVN
ncbi:MAG: hypothetical protein ACRDFT_09865 [bacterium]